MTLSEDVQKGLVAGAFGLVGTLIPVILSWSRDRDVASARLRKLEEATRRIAFWDQWLKLSVQVEGPSASGPTERVQNELTLLGDIIEGDALWAHAQLSKQQHRSSEFSTRIYALSRWRKLLLLYRPERSLAWFPRFLFYIGTLSSIFFLIIQMTDPTNVEGFLGLELMALVWIFVFRYLSRWLEEPHGTPLGVAVVIPSPPTPQ